MNVSSCSLGKELFYRRACNNVRNKLQLIYVANADFFFLHLQWASALKETRVVITPKVTLSLYSYGYTEVYVGCRNIAKSKNM